MVKAAVDTRDLTLPLGLLRHGLFEDLGPSWLRLDGSTEYQRAAYPEFVARASSASWFLPGSKASTFRLVKVPQGTATVASGFDGTAGALVGSDSVSLIEEHLPSHDHSYVDTYAEAASNSGGLLAGALKVASGLTNKTADRKTAKVGAGKPVPIKPPGFVAHLFVFAGRPRK